METNSRSTELRTLIELDFTSHHLLVVCLLSTCISPHPNQVCSGLYRSKSICSQYSAGDCSIINIWGTLSAPRGWVMQTCAAYRSAMPCISCALQWAREARRPGRRQFPGTGGEKQAIYSKQVIRRLTISTWTWFATHTHIYIYICIYVYLLTYWRMVLMPSPSTVDQSG